MSFRSRERGRPQLHDDWTCEPEVITGRDTIVRPRPSLIHPRLPQSQIKLSEAQMAQMAQLNELDTRIKALMQIAKPDVITHQAELSRLDGDICDLYERADSLKDAMNAKQMEISDITQQQAMQSHGILGELITSRKDGYARLRQFEETRTIYFTKLRDARQKYRVGSLDDALNRIDTIDDIIERETLSNQQLKKLLAEKDRLQSSLRVFRELEPDSEVQAAKEEENRLRDELRILSERIHELGGWERCGAEYVGREQLQRLRDEKKAILNSVNEVRSQIDRQFDEKRKIIAEFKQKQIEFRQNRDEMAIYQNEKSEILATADHTTILTRERQHNIDEMSSARNLNEPKIKVAASLIEYLSQFLKQENDQRDLIIAQKVPQDAIALIAQLRKPVKERKEQARKSSGAKATILTHDVETLKQFAKVEVHVPITMAEIIPTLEVLRDKMRGWTETFTDTKVSLEVEPHDHAGMTIAIC
jgi:hypothetical protein